MSASNGQPRPAGETKCDPRELPATVRLELALALHEGRALLTAAHVIEATLGPLAWGISPSQVRAVAASIRRLSPKLTERLINVCTRIERLALLTAERADSRAGLAAATCFENFRTTEQRGREP